MPWSFFSDNNGVLENIHIKWKDNCPNCPSIGLEVIVENNQQSIKDYVCLQSEGVCLYSGYFLNQDASKVMVSKGCPDENPDVLEITFKR